MEPEEAEYFEKHGLVFQEVIAHGGYGMIFKMYSPSYNQIFALKKISSELFHPEEVDCFKLIDDNRILNLYKSFTFNGFNYLLMEYCPDDVEKLIRRKNGKFSHTELVQLTHDIISCVKAVHDRNIAHCDIKPANFLIDNYGRIKICDFGLSKIIHEELQSKVFSGTKLFMSPEIVNKRAHDPFLSDIWSIGVTLFVLCTNTYPFYAFSTNVLFEKISRGIFDETIIPDNSLRMMISMCLDLEPTKRPSLDELLAHPFLNTYTHHKLAAPVHNHGSQKHTLKCTMTMSLNYEMITKPKINVRKSVTTMAQGKRIKLQKSRTLDYFV